MIAKLTLAAFSPQTRTLILDALDKSELLDICDALGVSPTSYSDTHSTAQQIANLNWQTLKIEIQIHIRQ